MAKVTIRNEPNALILSGRLGYQTILPVQMVCLLAWAEWCLLVIFLFPHRGRDTVMFGPGIFLAALFLAANLLNRAHVVATAAGIEAGVRPIPLPGFRRRRFLPAGEIADVYVTPFAMANRYTPDYTLSYEVHALTVDGESVPLLRRLPDAAAANDLAGLIRERTRSLPGTRPELRGQMRSVCESPSEFPGGIKTAALIWIGFVLVGLAPIVGPYLNTAGLTPVTATIVSIEDRWTKGTRYSYTKRVCIVRFDSPAGTTRTIIRDDCPKSAKEKDQLTVYYDPMHPGRAKARGSWMWPISVLFCALGTAGAVGLFLARPKGKLVGGARVLAEDTFRFPDRYWALGKESATARKGVLVLKPSDGSSVVPLWHRHAFGSVTIEARMRAREGGHKNEAAGVLFGATAPGTGYVFSVLPTQGRVDTWRVEAYRFRRLTDAVDIAGIQKGPDEWNVLQLEIADGMAKLYVNGSAAGTVPAAIPAGGAMAGLFAERPKGAKTMWEFSEFRIYNRKPN